MTRRVFRMITGDVLVGSPARVSPAKALLKGARRILVSAGVSENPGFILVRTRSAERALASDWAAIGGDISAAYHEAAGETGVLVEAAEAAGRVAAGGE